MWLLDKSLSNTFNLSLVTGLAVMKEGSTPRRYDEIWLQVGTSKQTIHSGTVWAVKSSSVLEQIISFILTCESADEGCTSAPTGVHTKEKKIKKFWRPGT